MEMNLTSVFEMLGLISCFDLFYSAFSESYFRCKINYDWPWLIRWWRLPKWTDRSIIWRRRWLLRRWRRVSTAPCGVCTCTEVNYFSFLRRFLTLVLSYPLTLRSHEKWLPRYFPSIVTSLDPVLETETPPPTHLSSMLEEVEEVDLVMVVDVILVLTSTLQVRL